LTDAFKTTAKTEGIAIGSVATLGIVTSEPASKV
jgi:hypothetical protein